jgi:hypothetical protein
MLSRAFSSGLAPIGLSLVLALSGCAAGMNAPRIDQGSFPAPPLKAGGERHVCNCGVTCPCHTIATREGTCTCGAPLTTAKVVSTNVGTAESLASGWEKPRTFTTIPNYAGACPCGTINQHPGRCACGGGMKKVE